ncbi:MAG: ribonuclease D [Acidobacteriota bacterium]|nr:ribonuclease D [Acidobacteriota bacterium]
MSSLIATNPELSTACARWSAAGEIGIDTEFVRERTYYPCPGLIQIADRNGVRLVDPLAVTSFEPLAGVLTDASVVKVMHACDEDLEMLQLVTGVQPSPVFDTQLAAAFSGHGASLSYGGLVKTLLGVTVEKDETRSNWRQRPLSPDQLRYAELDVTYLLPLHDRLSHALDERGRTAWFKEEGGHRARARDLDSRTDQAYQRVQGRGTLRPADHAVLRALSQWRETEARALDIPRRHLLTDHVLLSLATIRSVDAESLQEIRGLSTRMAGRYAERLAECVETARTTGPDTRDRRRNLRRYADTMKRLKQIVRHAAEATNLPAELLASRRTLETLLVSVLNHDEVPAVFRGWRFRPVTDDLLRCLNDPRSGGDEPMSA